MSSRPSSADQNVQSDDCLTLLDLDEYVSPEEEQALRDLYERLDMNDDGKICITDLKKAIESMKLPFVPGAAQVITKYMFFFL